MTGKIRQSIGRQYAPAELAGLFFAFSAAGWLWEVALHLVFNGELVKRGTMLGPWLPIYGAGGVLAVLLLRRAVRRERVRTTRLRAVAREPRRTATIRRR